jgi:hypothetical protein
VRLRPASGRHPEDERGQIRAGILGAFGNQTCRERRLWRSVDAPSM